MFYLKVNSMKKLLTLCGIVVCTVNLFTACQSTSNLTETADSYDYEESVITEAPEKNEVQKIKKEIPKKSAFSYGNKGEYEIVGETTIFGKSVFGKFEQKEANLVLRYSDENRGLGSKYNGQYYFCLFTENGIKALEKAYNKYLDDFNNKRLQRKSKKTLKTYGTTSATLRWGTFDNSTPNNGSGKAQLGYTFIENSPYFAITVPAVHNAHYDLVGDAAAINSVDYTIYLTKAQVKNLIDGLAPEVIDSYLYEIIQSQPKNEEPDEY